jgi:putative CocE/NonD family hydrolase
MLNTAKRLRRAGLALGMMAVSGLPLTTLHPRLLPEAATTHTTPAHATPVHATPAHAAPAAAPTRTVSVASTPKVVAAGPSGWQPQPVTYSLGSERNVGVIASDGTTLRADVYYPTTASGAPATGPFPVLLQQTPYGKENIGGSSPIANSDIPYFVDRGYIVVISDVRGTGTSGGTFGLFDPIQATDGATLVNWAAHLPHADGKVGLFGESYMGINQFLTVGALPANSPVKAMFPIISANDIYRDTVTQGGLLDIEFSSFYIALVAGLDAANPLLSPLQDLGAGSTSGFSSGANGLLLEELEHDASPLSYDLPQTLNIEQNGDEAYDGVYWGARNPVNILQRVVSDNIPAFLVGGWNDLFQHGELLNYTGLQNAYNGRSIYAPMTATEKVTPRYQLMMGPWEHVTAGDGVDLSQIQLEWFDTWLLNQDTPLAHTTTPLHLYQLQSGKWLDAAQWPLPQAGGTKYYFGAGPSSSPSLALNGGTLSTAAPTSSSGSDPVVFTGVTSACDIQTDQWSAGFLALASSYLHTTFPCDANDETLAAGPGALTYTTAPMKSAELLGGPIAATIYASATTTDTELVTTLEEVSPSGDSVPLTSGALLGSMRAVDPSKSWVGTDGAYLLPYHPYTQVSQTPVIPGKITRFDVEIFPSFAEVPAGWRVRLTLTTSDTPHLLPTLAQIPNLIGGLYQIQRNRLAASFINLPLAPASTLQTPCGTLCGP